jgi:5-methylcytosine-specific restriction endonuclease McrA
VTEVPERVSSLFGFGERLLNLLDQGKFTATYKYAVLLALLDLCLENPRPDGSAPDCLTARQLAEKVVEIYWPQTMPFTAKAGVSVLAQNRGGQAEIVSAIAKFRSRHAPDPSAPLAQARARAKARFERLVSYVEWKLIEMPLPRLQTVGETDDPFLYRIGWSRSVRRLDVEDEAFDGRIYLLGGSGECLVQFAGLLRPLIQREWARMVATLNRNLIDDSRLEEFLFGCQRIPTDAVRQPLRELQNNRCFYCEKAIREAAEVDHFIPWARHPDNGIENLVITDWRCNHDKRDFLPAGDYVRRWKIERFERNTSALAQIAERASWDQHPERTISVARTIYLRLPNNAKLWLQGRDFVNAESRVLETALGKTTVGEQK